MSSRSRVTYVTFALPLALGCARAGAVDTAGAATPGAVLNASQASQASQPSPPSPSAPALQLGSPRRPSIRTDRSRYAINDSAGIARLTIPLSYRNETGRPVYMPTCRGVQPPRLEKRVGERWIVAYVPIVSYCQGVPLSVRPGDSFNYTMNIVAGMPGTSYAPRFIVAEVPGTYRVLWEVFAGVQGDERQAVPVKDLLPAEWRISNEFQLVK